jgi:hypothetical protein
MGKPKSAKKTAMAVVPSGEVRVGIYVRRSTDEEHQPYSIEAQDTSLTAYIESQSGWTLAKRSADDASGATTNRPGLQRALKRRRSSPRGEDHSRRASNASDYLFTGDLRCPECGKAMIGTAANGRS